MNAAQIQELIAAAQQVVDVPSWDLDRRHACVKRAAFDRLVEALNELGA